MILWNHLYCPVLALLARGALATGPRELLLFDSQQAQPPFENKFINYRNHNENVLVPFSSSELGSNRDDYTFTKVMSGGSTGEFNDVQKVPSLTKLSKFRARKTLSTEGNANPKVSSIDKVLITHQDDGAPQRDSISLNLKQIAATKQPIPKFNFPKPPFGNNIQDDFEQHFFLEYYEAEIKMMQQGKELDWLKKGQLIRLSPRDHSTLTIVYAILIALEAHLQIFNGFSVSLSQADFQNCVIGDLSTLKDEAVTLTRLAEHGAKASLCEHAKKFNSLKNAACNERDSCHSFPTVRPIAGTAGFANKFELMRQLIEHGPVATKFIFTDAMEGFLEARKEKKKNDYIFRPEEHFKYVSSGSSVFSKYTGKLMGGVLLGFGYTRHHICFKLWLSLPELGRDQVVEVREDAVYFESMISFSKVILTTN